MAAEVLIPAFIESTGLTNFLLLIVIAETLELRTNVAKLFKNSEHSYTTFVPYKPSPTKAN